MPYHRPQYHTLTEERGKADLGISGSNTEQRKNGRTREELIELARLIITILLVTYSAISLQNL